MGADSPGTTDDGEQQPNTGMGPNGGSVSVETVITGLEVPWGAAYRDGTLFVTERPGRIVRIADGSSETVADLTDSTKTGGEGGLMGLVFHPEDPNTAFTQQTYATSGGRRNRVLRHDVPAGWAHEVVLGDVPGATLHDGGRLFVHDGALFVTTGDATDSGDAQDPQVLNGKVLRLTLDGQPHPDNPFGNEVFTYGHRNPEGLAASGGALYGIEHGPSSDDEINLLERGNNYGWPEVTGPSDNPDFTDPVVTYEDIIAPGGGAFYNGPIEGWQGDLFLGTLAGAHLRRVRIRDGGAVENEALYKNEFGRLRTPFVGPDGHLHVTTSNRDGRGSPGEGDDKILRFTPA